MMPFKPNSAPGHIGDCWRCYERDTPMFQDPLMPDDDRIGVCAACSIERSDVKAKYSA